ncbi:MULTISPECIES: DUF4430 domain-containing protein [Metabacillus]|uniref:Transcobalamin-like C-terminal domain-containing protein n=2 Tax=Metabacillus TaxID=2675233 RepID=A0A179T1M0_9BACI|nr:MULTISPECIES: DUF4430 domain-containing protein [Metabacillus]OAS87611.1 hypothetical protein A6K24_19400 [Metabacillus litoralis]QNF26992.1 DUF4430 domain-containing protein [Metabacillus sp. KUDC1714]
MRMYKVIIIAILSVILILSGCEKDEVVPIAEEKTTNVEQTTSEAQVEQKEETTTIEVQAEQSKQEQQESTESTSTTNDSSDDSDTVVTTKEEPKEPTKESTAQKSTTESSTNQTITTEKEETVTNKTSITTQKTQTIAEKKITTNEQSSNQTETEKEKEQTATPPKKEAPKQTVTISIVGDQQKGTILSSTKVEMEEGNTVLDITTKILKQKGIPISVTGGGSGAYVEGIANLFEFDHGPLSGWTVKRNGAKLDRSSGAVQVKSGDSIQWIYTSDYEEDGK